MLLFLLQQIFIFIVVAAYKSAGCVPVFAKTFKNNELKILEGTGFVRGTDSCYLFTPAFVTAS
ncbi:hypothetical protein [Parahaliea mediterranea]|uniref:Uncharacterized protein n=1 Tax=Parahaliea mediterranea TaxID=651086 RepID=A0A939IKT8_9GAMM|nr:hypothetical protein [Parahaliea mediterranea]MBN7795780.1 hypothetical protein [Parahaliea mediterranea]